VSIHLKMDLFNDELDVVIHEAPLDATEYIQIENLVECENLKKKIKEDSQPEMNIVDYIDNLDLDEEIFAQAN